MMKKSMFRKDKLYPEKLSKEELKELRNQLPKKEKNIDDIYNLIKILKANPKKILLSTNLYDLLLMSNWNCMVSDELKNYVEKGGKVEMYTIRKEEKQ